MDPPSIINHPSQPSHDEGLDTSDDNGREMNEPPYQQQCSNDQDDAVNNVQQHTINQPQHYNLLSSPIPSFQQVVHIPTPQQLAQKMLVARRGSNNNKDEKLFSSEQQQLPIIPPPWEVVSIGNNCTINNEATNYGSINTAFPAAQSDLPMSPLHQMMTTLPPIPITEDTSNVIVTNGIIDHNTTHIMTNNNNNNYNVNTSNNEQPTHHNHQTTTTRTKNVTFNTHDKFHTYDVQLETLKHVDTEFFNVAYYLIDVVNVDIGNLEYYMSSCSNIDEEEVKEGERSRRMEKEEGQRGGGGGGNDDALQYGEKSNNGLSPTVGCTGSSVLSKLFSCGMIDISSNMFNFNDDDHEEGIIILQQQQKEMEDNSILQKRQQQQQEQETRRINNNRRKKSMYQLTNKLVNDFVVAVKYRMEIIENDKIKSSSVVEEGKANNDNNNTSTTTSEDDADNVVKKTKDIARKMYAYGLPLVGMIPHPNGKVDDVDDDVEEGDAIGLAAAGHNDQENIGTLAGDKKLDDDFMDTFGKGPHRRQYFPVLPTDNDDDNEDQYHENGATNENDQYASNQLHLVTKGASPKKKKGFKLPTLSSVFSPSQPKSTRTAPSEDECKRRLAQIKLEINKSTSMMNASRNSTVQKACQAHMSKLQDEKRFYQIIQERHDIQSMLETTQVESVRSACKERFKQLIYELETLQMEKDKNDIEENNDGNCNTTFVSNPPHEEDENGEVEDSQWFNRILQYVNESTHERSAASIMATEPTPDDYLQLQQQQQQRQSTMMENFTPQVARNYQDGQTMGNLAPQAVARNYYPDDQDQNQYSYHHKQQTQHQRQSHTNNGQQILSPRRDTSNQRPPIAHAVKTRTQWF